MMFADFKEVTSQEPTEQVWKFLRFFLSQEHAEGRIRSIQGIPKGKYDADIRKQAKQVGYCIRQAEEYFRSSSQVSLATRPTLLYYGAASLSKALVLMKRDGEHSFDALRNKNRHNHHGLNVFRGTISDLGKCNGPEAFYNSLRCDINMNKQESSTAGTSKNDAESQTDTKTKGSIPWGHFPLFYGSLEPCAVEIPVEHSIQGKASRLVSHHVVDCADLLPIDDLIGNRFNGIDLLKSLPDMFLSLQELGVNPHLCRGGIRMSRTTPAEGSEGQKAKVTYHFFLNGLHQGYNERLKALYAKKNPAIKIWEDLGENLHLILDPQEDDCYFPDVVDDINNQKYFILQPETYVPEPAAHLVLLFCLGMMSRYYPDIWMKVLEKDVLTAEFTDSLLNMLYRKFPVLILDQITRTKHFIHA
jgi:hypothetical protein